MSSNFTSQYHRLNPQQKNAVDTIEGPVMVIAGAGTGKTQTIALRIANILDKTQIGAQNILCLTFTDNAAKNMRQRLLEIIGPPAYKVKIHTFHSFCNEVILTHPDQFIFAHDIESLEELDRLEIVQKLIENLPTGSVLKPFGDPLFYQKQIISAIQTLKRENISPLKLKKLVVSQKQFIKSSQTLYQDLKALRLNRQLSTQVQNLATKITKISPLSLKTLFQTQINLFSTGGFDIGRAKNPAINFKNALLKIIEDLQKQTDRQLVLQQIYRQYQKQLKILAKYDYEDMILFVIKAFKKNSQLLADYQENYLYLLVDEYQDSNSAQNKILELLSPPDSLPNLFVVGDDDQSIFRFQGAAIENLLEFQKNYDPKLVVLKNNYRSHQLILDTGLSVISHNLTRLSSLLKNIDKTLISQKKYDPDPINLFVANTQLEEQYFVANKIKKLIDSGTPPQQIAVLYRANQDPIDLLPFLDHLAIPYQISSGDNVLDQDHINNLLKLFKFLQNPSLDHLLFDILSSSSFIDLDPFDLLKLARHSYRHRLPLFDLIQNLPSDINILPSSQKNLKTFLKLLSSSFQDINSLSFTRAFNSIIRRFNYLAPLLKKNNIKALDQLHHFYTFFRKQSDQGQDLSQILTRLDLLVQNKISIASTNFDQDLPAVNLLTVHKAKGLEFEHVFIIRALDKKWGNGRNWSSLKLPYGIINSATLADYSDQNEDDRRLFYVALTRAKKQIYLSYAQTADNGRQLVPSIFLSEIKPELIQIIKPVKNLKNQALKLHFVKKIIPSLSQSNAKNYLKNYLKNHYRLNVTHLNSYLNCPICFYYKTILHIPDVKNKNLSFGTAVHATLTYLYNQLKHQHTLISQKQFIKIFKSALKNEKLSDKDHQEVLDIALANLPDYYNHYQSSFSSDCLSEYDFADSKVFVNNTPITGKIDRIQPTEGLTNKLTNARVFDYKTGRPDHKSLGKNSDYFRQLVFYKILSDNSPNFPFHITTGTIDFIQKNKQDQFIQKKYDFQKQDITMVTDLITQTYQDILNLKFDQIGSNCHYSQDFHHLLK